MALKEDPRAPESPGQRTYKLPVSVLVLVYSPDLDVLLLERADRPGFWQSVTGSQHAGETLAQTAVRELREETGIDAAHYRLVDWGKHNVYEIYPHWRYRYAPGITHNTEHVFALEVPRDVQVTVAPREHLRYAWLPWRQAADKAFSWSNAEAILELPSRIQTNPDAATRGT
jgi:dihydroneopterin triphosphate diphosphatase